MRNLLGNNCSKGCMIYLLALVGVVVLTSMGLSGLGTKFGADTQKTQLSPLYVPNSQPSSPTIAARPQGGGSTTNANANTQPVAQAAPTVTSVPVPAGNAQQTNNSTQPQSGTISGEASQPFYIVQAGDTLWDIATDYGVTVDMLKAVNGTMDEIIIPGELVYVPQAQPQQPAPAAPAPAPPTNQDPGGTIPTMPQTGIHNKP